MRLIKSVLFILLLVIPFIGHSQLSKTHYIPPLTSAEFGNANPEEQYIYLSTPSAVDIAYTIIPVGQATSNYITGVVSNTNPKEIYIGTDNGQLFMASSTTSTVTSNKGYIIEAEDVIYVSVRMNAGGGAQAGALVSKGLSALGNTFRVGSFINENPQSNYLNFVSVMATEDNTKVTFSDMPAGLVIKSYSGINPVVTLNEGQSYTIATNSFDSPINRDGLIGTLISSDKNIVVNCGSTNGSNHNGGGRDYGLDQIVGLSKVGKEYIFVRGDGSDGWENVLIVAHTNNTSISINGVATGIIINAGEYHLIEGTEYSSFGNMYVETSEDVFAYQGIGGGGEANQGMFFVPPLSCETRGNLDNIAQIEDIGSTTYAGGISIVTKVGATVTINNNPIGISPSTVTGNPDYETYKVTGLTGSVSVQSDDELYCAYFNYNGAATSGSFYSGFPSAPEINFDAAFVSLGICIPNITLSVANAANFDSFEWQVFDGSDFVSTNSSATEFTPTISGTYRLKGILLCSNLTLYSLEVPVSICPDDIDNDGIIDNIDIDNDNDGILNCVESYGDQEINLSNINGGSIPIGGYTYIGNVTPIGNVASTPLTGSVDGTFMSETPSKSGFPLTSVNYDLTFNKNLNLRFEYATSNILGNGLLTDDEEFIIQVPNTRTITLVDPDDQLLVDSNYDGVYESGVTQISSFQIRFKLKNPSLAFGSGTFSFLANSVNGFNYTHINNSDTSTKQATFKITATCVAKDNDNDGIEDALDYDSDNDGIPDFVEGTGTNIVLTGTDSDGDGLDDVFNVNAVPLDSDADGVFDYLDLDSDNDGIYDLEESASGLPDIISDGMVDNVSSSDIGLNGWIDVAETTPDSGLLNYTIPDTDSDITLNYIDNDSDGDNCFDVFEAGFSDTNNDGFLGNAAVNVDINGVVTNASDGYTAPNNDYLISALILIETQPVDTESCELSDTFISIESSTADNYQWEISTDGLNWNTIVDDAVYSNSLTNTLQITATPLLISTSMYRVFLNKIGNACGLYSDEITLTVILLPIANSAPTMILCDDDNNGTMPFDLVSQNSSINTVPGMTITYHATQSDADSNMSPLSSPFESGNTIIFARVENDLNTTCIATSSFNLEVYESAFPLDSASMTPLLLCDDVSQGSLNDGLIISDLTQKETEILNSQLSSEFTLTYFTDPSYTAISKIIDPANFKNTSANNQTIFVRMTNNLQNTCYTDTSFELQIFETPIAIQPLKMVLCDDDNNGTMPFDLVSQNSSINAVPDMTITYHTSQPDADSNTDPLSSPFESGNTTIFARVENSLNTTCFATTFFDIEVYDSPFPSTLVPNLAHCDDTLSGSDTDGKIIFDLTMRETDILNGQDPNEFTLSYFTDASYLNPIPAPKTYPNSIPGTQTIYVRMTNNLENSCYSDTSFNIVVFELPVVNTPNLYSQCDDESNDGFALFNLTLPSIKEEISPNYITEGLIFTYYTSQIEAENSSNAITSPTNYQNTDPTFNSETVWIRIENPNGCFRVETIELEVNPSSAALASYIPTPIFQCDDGTDNRDGVATFDLTNIHDYISTTIFPTFTATVHFYESLSDAELENNEIQDIANHQNSNSPNIQNIWVRVKSDSGNNCLGLEGFSNLLNVEILPMAYAPATLIVCDDDQDGVFNFDTSNVESDILNGQSLADVSISYFNAAGNPLQDFNGVFITSPFPSTFLSTSQIINYTLINNSTNDPDGACTDSNALEFIVDLLPINNTVIITPLCDPYPDDGLLIADFDTTTLESNIGAQSGMEITYFDAAMNPLLDYNGDAIVSPFPSSFLTGTQTITIIVTNPINVSCPITNSINFIVDELPEFTVESSRIICESGPNSIITLDVYQDDPSEVLDYEWTDESGVFISNTQSIAISSSGTYTVTLTKTNGSGCSRSREIYAVYSEKANLDYDDITIIDDSDNNTITINNDNGNLGKGDYEYSLDDEYGPYQDEPFFDYVIPGIHIIYIKDKNECGISSLEVSVIGYPKFFTPNNDGHNDYWQVLGVNQNFYNSSIIYIYDRFGKIITKVDPTGPGWDGYYNGAQLPSDDYWFSAQVEDSNGEFIYRKGHFSLIRR